MSLCLVNERNEFFCQINNSNLPLNFPFTLTSQRMYTVMCDLSANRLFGTLGSRCAPRICFSPPICIRESKRSSKVAWGEFYLDIGEMATVVQSITFCIKSIHHTFPARIEVPYIPLILPSWTVWQVPLSLRRRKIQKIEYCYSRWKSLICTLGSVSDKLCIYDTGTDF
jgi:hypothetical protein